MRTPDMPPAGAASAVHAVEVSDVAAAVGWVTREQLEHMVQESKVERKGSTGMGQNSDWW